MEPPPDGTLDLPIEDRVGVGDALAPGRMVSHFVIRGRLGEGGMGVVLAAEDPALGRRVAIKLLKSDTDQPAYRARLLREAQAMARLEHPNIVRVHEIGEHEGRLFVAMELVDGVTLAVWLRQAARTWREVIAVFQQVGAGLASVHRAGFVHRDFKPENVLVDREGRARVADFGLARIDPSRASQSMSPALAASLTRTGVVMGTPRYMAPEQQFGGELDARADQFSFCVALHEALIVACGEWGRVPRALRAVVNRGLAFEPDERFSSMDALLVALVNARSRRGTWIGAALVTTVLGGAFTFAALADGAPPAAPVVAIAADAAVPPPPVPADAAVVVEVPVDAAPIDAGVARTRTPADAGTAVVLRPPPPLVGAGSGSGSAKVDPARREMDPTRIPAVTATIRELGYGGLTFTPGEDLGVEIAKLREKLSGLVDPYERGVYLYAIGAAERRRDDCVAAQQPLAEAKKQVLASTKGGLVTNTEARYNSAFTYYGRIQVTLGMCQLAAGQALAAEKTLGDGLRNLFTATARERAEVLFAEAIVKWETGDTERAAELMRLAGQRAVALQPAITAYARAVGAF